MEEFFLPDKTEVIVKKFKISRNSDVMGARVMHYGPALKNTIISVLTAH